jgi:hypothetical protein
MASQAQIHQELPLMTKVTPRTGSQGRHTAVADDAFRGRGASAAAEGR